MDNPWEDMYSLDKDARDRVMASARLLLPHVKRKQTVLDIGCFTQEAKKYFPSDVQYIGIDKQDFHKDNKVVDLDNLEELPGCDHVLCLETLEHLVHPKKVLDILYNNLKHDARLVVSLPNEATFFHRLRCLFGTVDAECFSSQGKHLHLPSLKQARLLLGEKFEILSEQYYTSHNAYGSRSVLAQKILPLVPKMVLRFLSNLLPSLFARGFIFLLKKRLTSDTDNLKTI